MTKIVLICHECGAPPDPQYDMDYTDVQPGAIIRWCSTCGPKALKMQQLLTEALQTRGLEFARELEAELDKRTN